MVRKHGHGFLTIEKSFYSHENSGATWFGCVPGSSVPGSWGRWRATLGQI